MAVRESCPICGEGHVTALVERVAHEYNGVEGQVDRLYQSCDQCGEFSGAAEAKQNKRYIIKFRKQVDGLLTGQEVAAIRTRLGLTQTKASEVFGGGPVAFSKYESDDVAQSASMDKLLRIALQVPAAFQALKDMDACGTDVLVGSKSHAVYSESSKVDVYEPKEFRDNSEVRMKAWR